MRRFRQENKYTPLVSSKPANVTTISDGTGKAAGGRVQTATSLTSSTVLVLRRTVVHVLADLKTCLLAAETGTQSSADFYVAYFWAYSSNITSLIKRRCRENTRV